MEAVDHLDLEVPEGAIYALTGSNGAGKTTAIKTMMNIIEPSGGRAEILGCDSRRLGPANFEQIGYISENQTMPDWMTVDYLLNYLKPFYPAWDDARAEGLLRQFDLPRARKLRHLSRGMWMKAALVSSLSYRPRLLMLDEPFSGLDPVVREDLIEGIRESRDETTVLVSSHDLGDVENFASHAGYMDRGRLRVSEEMTSLIGRFREIEIVLNAYGSQPPENRWPPGWVRREASAGSVRFVDTRFHKEETVAEIRQLFTGVKSVSAAPMSLRAIFLTLARGPARIG